MVTSIAKWNGLRVKTTERMFAENYRHNSGFLNNLNLNEKIENVRYRYRFRYHFRYHLKWLNHVFYIYMVTKVIIIYLLVYRNKGLYRFMYICIFLYTI